MPHTQSSLRWMALEDVNRTTFGCPSGVQVLGELQTPIMDCAAAQYATDGALQESIAERCASVLLHR